jgi:benzoate/toluate 1,2-dioxygenase reductase component
VEGVSPTRGIAGDGIPGQLHPFSSRLVRRTWLSESAFEVELERPKGFSFSAGQSVRVFAGDAGRDYSLAGGPSAGSLSLCVRLVKNGAVSPFLAEAPLESDLNFTGPHGVFTLAQSERPVVWAATGVGMAPFLSMVRAGATGFMLLHGVRGRDELFHRDELEAAAARYVPCLSRETASGCFSGRVTAWAAANLEPHAYDIFLCGNRRMVRDFLVLVDERLSGSRVFTEIFF